MAEVVTASYGFWNDQSGRYFDIVFFGWLTDGPRDDQPHHGMYFDRQAFGQAKDEVERLTKWRYSGETDFLLLDWQHDLNEHTGDFVFDRAVPLRIEELIREGKVGSVDAFVQGILNHAREQWPPGAASPTWEISDRLGLSRGRRALWEWVSRTFLRDAGRIYDEMRPFAICDLRT